MEGQIFNIAQYPEAPIANKCIALRISGGLKWSWIAVEIWLIGSTSFGVSSTLDIHWNQWELKAGIIS